MAYPIWIGHDNAMIKVLEEGSHRSVDSAIDECGEVGCYLRGSIFQKFPRGVIRFGCAVVLERVIAVYISAGVIGRRRR